MLSNAARALVVATRGEAVRQPRRHESSPHRSAEVGRQQAAGVDAQLDVVPGTGRQVAEKTALSLDAPFTAVWIWTPDSTSATQ